MDAAEERSDRVGLIPSWVERDVSITLLVDLKDLEPLARILATTDGTVTEILEAWADDNVVVGQLSQANGPLPRPVAALDANAGTPVLRRNVLLVGARSQRPLLYAESLTVTARVPAAIRDGLQQGGTPIGKLLRGSRLETYRELLHLGRGAAGPLAAQFRISPAELLVERTYRIFAGGRPIMLINEKFPARSGRSRIA
jgi:chorismate-pyruvate lyase